MELGPVQTIRKGRLKGKLTFFVLAILSYYVDWGAFTVPINKIKRELLL